MQSNIELCIALIVQLVFNLIFEVIQCYDQKGYIFKQLLDKIHCVKHTQLATRRWNVAGMIKQHPFDEGWCWKR